MRVVLGYLLSHIGKAYYNYVRHAILLFSSNDRRLLTQ